MDSQYSFRKHTQKEGGRSSNPTSPTNISTKSQDEDFVNITLDDNPTDNDRDGINSGEKQTISHVKNHSDTPKAQHDVHNGKQPNARDSNGDHKVIEEKAQRLLREGHITPEEYKLVMSNHTSAMNRTTIPPSPSPPPPVSRPVTSTSPNSNNSRLSRLSRRRFMAEQQAISSLSKAEAKKQQQSKIRHQQITVNMETWRNKILPRWDDYRTTSVVSRLVQQGIPTSLRGRIWCLMLHDKLKISPQVYQDHLEEALQMYDSNGRLSLVALDSKEKLVEDEGEDKREGDNRDNDNDDYSNQQKSAEERIQENTVESDKLEQQHEQNDSNLTASSVICQAISNENTSSPTKDRNSFTESSEQNQTHLRNSVSGSSEKIDLLIASMTLIQRDIPRTFPTLSFFHDDGPLASSLDHVLKAYACYEPNIGYVQGMSFIAALLLLYMDEYETFVCFSNLLAIRTNRDFYLLQRSAIDGYVATFDRFFKQYLPLLSDHFDEEGISSEIFLLDWHLTIFAKALPLEIAARIWDCYLHCGEVYVLRASLGLLRMFARRLSSLGIEKILPFLAHVPEEELSAEELISSIEHIKISPEKYRSMRIQCDSTLERDSVSMGAIAHESNSSPSAFSFRKTIASIFS